MIRNITLAFSLILVMTGYSWSNDPCELEKLLGGESAYRECLIRQPEPSAVPVAPKKPLPQPVRPTPVRPVEIIPSASVAQSAPRNYSPSELFNRVKDSVFVVVAAKNDAAVRRENFTQGSAVAISNSKLWTNCHVVDGNRYIYLYQQDEMHDVRLIWRDRKTDRCILEVDNLRLRPVSAIRDFDSLNIGEKVYTVGAPYGLEQTLGEGLVSGKRNRDGVNLIQTSAPIAFGSSGGGLFDEQGRLVGITTFLIKEAQALNFAIAADAFPR